MTTADLIVIREAFKGFDYNVVARMDEKDIDDIVSNKELKLAEEKRTEMSVKFRDELQLTEKKLTDESTMLRNEVRESGGAHELNLN